MRQSGALTVTLSCCSVTPATRPMQRIRADTQPYTTRQGPVLSSVYAYFLPLAQIAIWWQATGRGRESWPSMQRRGSCSLTHPSRLCASVHVPRAVTWCSWRCCRNSPRHSVVHALQEGSTRCSPSARLPCKSQQPASLRPRPRHAQPSLRCTSPPRPAVCASNSTLLATKAFMRSLSMKITCYPDSALTLHDGKFGIHVPRLCTLHLASTLVDSAEGTTESIREGC
mmetsp:Transcript_28902/g.47949  ORF Transcript_28902/g.47949 Transcript_28902/m.47949 type:complete len:227 (-) Transcript_28902:204-884(-)